MMTINNYEMMIFLGRVSPLPTYYIPKDGPLGSYREYVSMLPNMDHPEAFGQHPNADITSQIQEARALFETLLSMQPQVVAGAGESREEKVWGLAWRIWFVVWIAKHEVVVMRIYLTFAIYNL